MNEDIHIGKGIDEKHIPRILRLADAHRGKEPVLSIALNEQEHVAVFCGTRHGRSGRGIKLVFGKVDGRWKLISKDYWIS